MDAVRLIEYNHALWRRFADYYVTSCSWEELSRNHETSHHSIANVTMHAVNMEDWYLHYVLPGKPWDGPAWDGFKSAADMRARVASVESKTRELLRDVTREALDLPRKVKFGDDAVDTTLRDLLLETVNEATHHRGEVLAMLWRTDKEPPYVNYLDWVAGSSSSK